MKGIRQPVFPAVASKCERDETSVNKSDTLGDEGAAAFPALSKPAAPPQDFALCLAK